MLYIYIYIYIYLCCLYIYAILCAGVPSPELLGDEGFDEGSRARQASGPGVEVHGHGLLRAAKDGKAEEHH